MLHMHSQNDLVRRWLAASAHQIASDKSFTSGGIAAAQNDLMRRTEGRCSLSIRDPARFREFGAGELRLADTAIRFLTYDAATECRKSTRRSPDRAHIILQCVLSGSLEVTRGDRHVRLAAGQALITGSVGETIKCWRGKCSLLNIIMPEQALARILASECAPEDRALIRLGQMEMVELGSVSALAHLVGAVVADLSESRPAFRAEHAAAQAEHALHLLALKSFAVPDDAASTRRGAGSTAVPFYVRRAESYMRDHLQQPLTVHGIAEFVGVSPRTLQYGFKAYRHTTPMEFLRTVRLSVAREALVKARSTGRKVSEIAELCGYVSLSHFSRDYRAWFDESPSDTIRIG